MRAIVVVAVSMGLGACATQAPPEPIVKTVTVNVPVAMSCVPKDLGPPPAYPDTRQSLLAALDAISRARLVEEGWGIRDTRLSLLEGVVSACRVNPEP